MGSYYIQRLRGLPREMKNCAWVFDMIPMEVSVVFELNGRKLEFPSIRWFRARGQS